MSWDKRRRMENWKDEVPMRMIDNMPVQIKPHLHYGECKVIFIVIGVPYMYLSRNSRRYDAICTILSF